MFSVKDQYCIFLNIKRISATAMFPIASFGILSLVLNSIIIVEKIKAP